MENIIGITTSNCPYCNFKLDKFPARKIKCKNCGNQIYVRTRPSDRKKILIKDHEVELIEKEWEKLRTLSEEKINNINKIKSEYHCKNLENFKNSGIKFVKLICCEECDCCKDILDKKIPLNKIKSLPIKECPLVFCHGVYTAILDYDD